MPNTSMANHFSALLPGKVFNHLSHKSMHQFYIKIIFYVFHDSKEDEIQKRIKCTSFMTVHYFRVHTALEEIPFKS